MSFETVDKIIEFIESHTKIEGVSILWFGGEPLMALDIIEYFLNKCEERNIKIIAHSIITNGYLLNRKACQLFNKYPLNSIQITIDGEKEVHNKRRKLGSQGEDSYSQILENVDQFFLSNTSTTISIRVNIDKTNSAEFVKVYNELNARWEGKNLYIYPGFVVNFNNCVERECVMDYESRINLYVSLYKDFDLNVGFYPNFHIQTCVADNINGFVIGTNGEYYKCWNDLGIESKIIGFIGEKDMRNPQLFTNYTIGFSMYDDDECAECLLFPICGGGCRWFRLNSANNREDFICTHRKKYLNSFLEMHYEQQLKSKNNTL